MKLSGKIRIEFHDEYGNQTQEPVEETNLIFNQTFVSILGATPSQLFSDAYIAISSTPTPPDFNTPTITNILATGSVPDGIISPIWYESVTPNFGEIQNRIAAPTTPRTFYTVGLSRNNFGSRQDLTASLLTIPCTQNAFEVLTIYYRIEVVNSAGERLTSRFVRDFGGSIFGKKECAHSELGVSYSNAPVLPYIDAQQDRGIIDNRYIGLRWDAASIVSSHYKYKESRTFKIAQSGVVGDTDEAIGIIFNSLLTGASNSISSNNSFIAGYTENTSSAYRISAYASKTVNIDPTKPVFIPPFQKIWSHRINASVPFFDPNNAAIGTAYPKVAGSWVGKWPEIYRYTIVNAGAMGVSTYKFSKRLHLGFNGNAYSDRTIICPFRNPNTPAAIGMHGWRVEDNDLLRFSNTQIVQYDNTGVTLLDLMDGSYINWDTTTTPILNVTKLRQCAVDTTNKLIYCACRDTGLWIIDVINGTTIQQVPTPCYGVDVGRNNTAFGIFEGFLRRSTDWTVNLTIVYVGLTDGFWSRAFFLKADPANVNDLWAIAIDSPSSPGSSRRVVWYDAGAMIASTGYDSANVKQWAASLDVSDTNSFWAIASLKLTFGNAGVSAIASPPTLGVNHSVWGNVGLYKISFYNEFFIGFSSIVNSLNVSQNNYDSLGATATILHLQGGIVVLSNAVRQLFTDNIYAWENYGWNGSAWVLGNTNSKLTHTSSDSLTQGLTIQWNAGTFQLGDFFTQGILNGTWKDNATTVFIENFWYTKAVHFDVALTVGLTVPSAAPYEIVFPVTSNPVFLRIETDSVNALNKFTLSGIAVPTIYVNGETPGPGELTIYPTSSGAKAVFNAVDVGKIWAGTYSWIEV